MLAYASRTGTRRNLAALRASGWRLLVSAAGVLRNDYAYGARHEDCSSFRWHGCQGVRMTESNMARVASSQTSQWYTPIEYIQAAADCMGGIDLDPASNAVASAYAASHGLTHAWCGLDNPDESRRDGLSARWEGRVWVNPPTPPRPWFERAAARGAITIYMAYSIEVLQQAQRWVPGALDRAAICIPERRVRFLTPVADRIAVLERRQQRTAAFDRELSRLRELPPDSLVPGDDPAHASAIIGFGVVRGLFRAVFERFGIVI